MAAKQITFARYRKLGGIKNPNLLTVRKIPDRNDPNDFEDTYWEIVSELKQTKILAAKNMDWRQVIGNGCPPCFHLEADGRFCGRAERWDGHKPFKKGLPIHNFISLADLLNDLKD